MMQHYYLTGAARATSYLRFVAALWLLWLLSGPAAGQVAAGTWSLATTGSSLQANGSSIVRATAVDASGNVFVTGNFLGQVAFGSTLLTSAGGYDLFVAKYVPATNTWAWAQSGGGIGEDRGYGLAVSGSSVYVTGTFGNNTANVYGVAFGGTSPTTGTTPVRGATSVATQEVLLAKYTDQGSSATLGWVQVGGGTGDDYGYGVAASGSSIYVTGSLFNNRLNDSGVVFGGTASTTGTQPQYGATSTASADVLLAKYTDNGATATFNWSQVGGGTRADAGYGLAVSGSSVYVTGSLYNNTLNANGVLLGGAGTTAGTQPQYGATSTASADIVVAKYTDNGATATFSWSQVGGGTREDIGTAIAVSGPSVYVTGTIINTKTNGASVVFGGSGTVAGTAPQYGAGNNLVFTDLVLAKYTDNGANATLGWTQVGGGNDSDGGQALAASGSTVYVAGYFAAGSNNYLNTAFGGSGTTAGTLVPPLLSPSEAGDMLVAKYADQGASATVTWLQAGGGGTFDMATSLALTGTTLYVGGLVGPSAAYAFGTVPTPLLNDNGQGRAVLTQLTDTGSSSTWQALAACFGGGTSVVRGTTTDASGNVFVTGYFVGQVVFGTTTLSSVGKYDLFVAKYVPATNAWAWAQSGGGTDDDYGYGIAVSGSSVYVTGSCFNDRANTNGALFGGTGAGVGTVPQYGASTVASDDLVLTKYTDNGTSATLGWVQVAGGTGNDRGYGVAASGSSVYVTGSLFNNLTNDRYVVLGGTGTVAGTVLQYGNTYSPNSDLLVAKYTDNGPSATVTWTQVGGGSEDDIGYGIAVQNTGVYVTGQLFNSLTNSKGVLFGSSGTTLGTALQYGATSVSGTDIVVAKYTDNGPTATFRWSQVGGGTSYDYGTSIAVSGASVYVAAAFYNDRANSYAGVFGGAGTAAGTAPQYGASATTSYDLLVAKYTDNGASASLGWTQVGGGTRDDYAYGIAAGGTGVFVTGNILNTRLNTNAVLFGGSGATAGTVSQAGLGATNSNDLVVAGYTDNGPTATLAWTRVGGGSSPDFGYATTLRGGTLYVVGSITPLGMFGSLTVPSPATSVVNFLGALNVSAMLGTTTTQAPAGRLALFPNPASGAATLTGATAHTPVLILDALGRRVAAAAADANGAAALPVGLVPGVYLVRAGASTVRWVVQ